MKQFSFSNLKSFGLAVMLVLGAVATVLAGDITITVYESDGTTPIQGVSVQYFDGSWKNVGTTNASGEATKTITDGTYDFRATYKGTVAPNQSITVSGTSTGTFYTTQLVVRTRTSDSSSLDGVAVAYNASGWKNMGNSSGGQSTAQVFAGTYDIRAQYKGSEAIQTGKSVPGDGATSGVRVVYTFFTSTIIVQTYESDGTTPISGISAKYALQSGGGWKGMGSTDASGETTAETFGDKYTVEISYLGVTISRNFNLPVLPASGGDGSTKNRKATVKFYTTKVTVKVCDSDGNPIQGATARWKTNTYRNLGPTDVNGEVVFQTFKTTGVLVESSYNFTTSPELSINIVGSNTGANKNREQEVKFYTTKVTAKVSCGGTDVENINTQYKTNTYRNIGNTDASGEATIQLYPGTYDFRARNGGTEEEKLAQVVPGDAETASQSVVISFAPTTVTIHYDGGSVHYNTGSWQSASGTRYLFPGTYNFRFGPSSNYRYQDIVISGCTFEKTAVVITLNASDASPIAGVSATGGTGSSYTDWTVDPTNASGYIIDLVDGNATNVNYQMVYNNTTAQISQDVSSNAFVAFQTELIQLELKSCAGPLIDGASATFGVGTNSTDFSFPGGVTGTAGSGLTEAEMFAGNYTFKMNYAQLAQDEFNWDVPTSGSKIQFFVADVMTISLAPSAYGTCCNISVNGGSDGSIEVNVENSSNTSYTYTWTGSWSGATPTGGFPTGLSAGLYKVLVTDSNGCYGNGGPIWLIEP